MNITLQRIPGAFVFQEIYNKLSGFKFGGYFHLTKPVLMIRDPQLVKDVLVTNFSHFKDRTAFLAGEKDSLSSHLLHLTGDRWKKVRQKLMPAFCPTNVRLMKGKMKSCIDKLDNYLTELTAPDSGTGEVDMSEIMARFATEVIGIVACGVECNALEVGPSEIRQMEALICEPDLRNIVRDIFRNICPRVNRLFNFTGHRTEVDEFFMGLWREAKESRKVNAEHRDFIQFLVKLQASDLSFSECSAAANFFFIFIAGFSTVASTLAYCMYELALHPAIWERLKKEVETVREDKLVDFDTLKDLQYMDMVLKETMRKYPVFPTLQRKCTEAFEIFGENGHLLIEEGTDIIVSVQGLHHDEKYWPNPEEFRPERFSEDNKNLIKAGTYLPFGDGPRGCFGSTFAKYEMQLLLAYMVTHFTVEQCEKTAVPLDFVPRGVSLAPKNGIWLRISRQELIA